MTRQVGWIRIILLGAMAAVTAAELHGHWFLGDDYRIIDVVPEFGWNLREHFEKSVEYPIHWSPIGGLLWWIEMTLFGPNPFPYHLVSCLIHLGTALILGNISDRFSPAVVGTFAAAMFYGLFAHYEITAMITSSNNGGAASLFLTAGVWFYLRHWESERFADFAASATLFFLALGSKEDGVAFLPIIAGHTLMMRNFTRRRLAFLAVITIMTALYFAFSTARLSHNYFTDHGMVNVFPGRHWIEVICLYAGVLPASFLLPVKTLSWISLESLGAILLITVAIAFRRISCGARLGFLWMLGGITPFLAILLPWQSRYTVVPAAGFCLMTCALARFPKLRWFLGTAIVLSFLCRLIAQEKYYAVHSEFYGGADPAAIAIGHFEQAYSRRP